jgi:type II secretory pathway pseudopilin PulG
LIELLCVMCILSILASLHLPAVFRAYSRAKGFAEEFEVEEIASLLLHQSREYCAAHAQFQFASKTDYADKCHFWPKCRSWIEASATEFVPFGYLTPTNLIVLQVHLGPRHRTLYSYTSGDLSVRPPER